VNLPRTKLASRVLLIFEDGGPVTALRWMKRIHHRREPLMEEIAVAKKKAAKKVAKKAAPKKAAKKVAKKAKK